MQFCFICFEMVQFCFYYMFFQERSYLDWFYNAFNNICLSGAHKKIALWWFPLEISGNSFQFAFYEQWFLLSIYRKHFDIQCALYDVFYVSRAVFAIREIQLFFDKMITKQNSLYRKLHFLYLFFLLFFRLSKIILDIWA